MSLLAAKTPCSVRNIFITYAHWATVSGELGSDWPYIGGILFFQGLRRRLLIVKLDPGGKDALRIGRYAHGVDRRGIKHLQLKVLVMEL